MQDFEENLNDRDRWLAGRIGPSLRERGMVFVGGQDGSMYALNTATGCAYWSTAVQAQVRSGITVGEIAGAPAPAADAAKPN